MTLVATLVQLQSADTADVPGRLRTFLAAGGRSWPPSDVPGRLWRPLLILYPIRCVKQLNYEGGLLLECSLSLVANSVKF